MPTARQPKMPGVDRIGRNLIANVERLRQERGMSMRRLSAEIEAAGRPIPPLGISRTLEGERRIDVDEAVALTKVFGVTLGELLASPDSTAHRAAARASRIAGLLEVSGEPDGGPVSRHVDRALRRLEVEVEELLEGDRPAA